MHYSLSRSLATGKRRDRNAGRGARGPRKGCITAYADENMGGFASLSSREKYRFGRMARTAVKLIGHVAEELRVSRFSRNTLS